MAPDQLARIISSIIAPRDLIRPETVFKFFGPKSFRYLYVLEVHAELLPTMFSGTFVQHLSS